MSRIGNKPIIVPEGIDVTLNGKVISGILKYVNEEKLVIICGRNKIKDSKIRIIETSNCIKDMEYIKLHAKTIYQEALDKFLQELI